jgi:hypothetical protein
MNDIKNVLTLHTGRCINIECISCSQHCYKTYSKQLEVVIILSCKNRQISLQSFHKRPEDQQR